MTAVKRAEDENALVVRFYEWAGKDGEITLQLPAGAQAAVDTDLMEEPMGDAALHDGKVRLQTKPYEIKIIKVQFSSRPKWQRRQNHDCSLQAERSIPWSRYWWNEGRRWAGEPRRQDTFAGATAYDREWHAGGCIAGGQWRD